jgi:L-lactate dehydrogenase
LGDISLVATGDRNHEMRYTVSQLKATMPKVMASGFNGVIISITNPCDTVADLVYKLSGLPKGRVFGTGTGLDTSRLVSALAQQTGYDHQAISAYMIGEHGASQMAAWSCVSFGGAPLAALEGKDERFTFDKDELQRIAINAGWVTYHGKQCTEYGICSTLARMVRAVLHDEKRIMPVSMLLEGEYGEENVFAGVPCVIGKNGVEEVIELPLTEEEKAKFHICCEDIRKHIKEAEAIEAVK